MGNFVVVFCQNENSAENAAGVIHWSIISVALHTYANCGIGLSVDAFFASCITCVTLRTTLQQKFPKSVKHYDKNQDLPEEFQVVEVQLLGGEQLNHDHVDLLIYKCGFCSRLLWDLTFSYTMPIFSKLLTTKWPQWPLIWPLNSPYLTKLT